MLLSVLLEFQLQNFRDNAIKKNFRDVQKLYNRTVFRSFRTDDNGAGGFLAFSEFALVLGLVTAYSVAQSI